MSNVQFPPPAPLPLAIRPKPKMSGGAKFAIALLVMGALAGIAYVIYYYSTKASGAGGGGPETTTPAATAAAKAAAATGATAAAVTAAAVAATGSLGNTITLYGGAQYVDNTQTSFQTMGTGSATAGYALSQQPYTGGCTVACTSLWLSGYNVALYIGLTEQLVNPSVSTEPTSYVMYVTSQSVWQMINGVNNESVGPYVSKGNSQYGSGSNDYAVSYNGTDILFFVNGIEIPENRISVGAGKTYYGAWSSYNPVVVSKVAWFPTPLIAT